MLTHMEQQKNNAISSSVQDLEVKLKRANEEKNQSKVVIEEYKNKPKGFEDQHESDSAPRTDQVKEAQRPAEVTTPAMYMNMDTSFWVHMYLHQITCTLYPTKPPGPSY